MSFSKQMQHEDDEEKYARTAPKHYHVFASKIHFIWLACLTVRDILKYKTHTHTAHVKRFRSRGGRTTSTSQSYAISWTTANKKQREQTPNCYIAIISLN